MINIFTDFFSKELPSAASDARPGADGLRIQLDGGNNICIYMDAADATTYATAINRAKLDCLARRLHNQKPSTESKVA